MVDSATLCALRGFGSNTEALLTRRAYWNTHLGRPFSFPGEWVFPGGSQNPGEKLIDTAVREFREEVLYEGAITELKFLRKGKLKLYTDTYNQQFYTARLDAHPTFGWSDEVIEYRWMQPTRALQEILDPAFTVQLEQEYAIQRLANTAYGARSISKRILPAQTIKTLELLEKRFAA